MRVMKRNSMAAAALAAVALLGLTACTMDSSTDTSSSDDSGMMDSSPEATDDALTADLVGTACADYAAAVPDGDGSISGMSMDPVAVAASNNPLLTTLTAAVSGQLNPDVNLVDTRSEERRVGKECPV